MTSATSTSIRLPTTRRGRRSAAQQREYDDQLRDFAVRLREIASALDFKCGTRGWCYMLEPHGLGKGDFDRAERLINDCRKCGLLPVDFTAEDGGRAADNLPDEADWRSPEQYAEQKVRNALAGWHYYTPADFWDQQDVYVEMLVEKIDLKSLFLPVCEEYHVPIANARGWGDINGRALLMQRFSQHEAAGRQCVLLYCGDFDPGGLCISECLRDNLAELEQAVGWSPDNLLIERFGLNYDFIKANDLTWINNLETSGGKRLDDPRHPHHHHPYVRDYLANYGARKVEANALVVHPDAGRELCREAIERHVTLEAVEEYEGWLEDRREEVRAALPAALQRAIAENGGES
jgi:hypothetical protein